MGSCVSRSTAAATMVGFGQVIATVMVVDLDGSMAQFAEPVMAHEALGDGPRCRASCFVCSSDELYCDEPVRALAAHDALQVGQLYFVLPLSMLGRPLSGQDMAALAVKASAALGPAAVAVDVDRSSAGVASQGKNGGGEAGKQPRWQTARVAPLVVVGGNENEPAAYADHVYGGYDTHKTVYGDRTVGKTGKGVGHMSGTARHRAGAQRLSVIVEGGD